VWRCTISYRSQKVSLDPRYHTKPNIATQLGNKGLPEMMVKTLPTSSSDETFEYLKMFNYVVVSDEALAARLPETEFELSFSREGDIYVDGKPIAVNVKECYEALVRRQSWMNAEQYRE
jgi:hypothetical protein